MNGYDIVKTEILKLAVSDYKRALKSKNGYIMLNVSNYRTVVSAIELENWFLSGWGQMLSGGQGELIIELCKKAVKKEQEECQAKNTIG